MNINEEQLLTMSSAIVEAYKIEGAKLYAIKYTEPGNQEAAVITYEPRKDIVTLIKNNPNIVKEAMTSLYSNLTSQYRENQINKYYDSLINRLYNLVEAFAGSELFKGGLSADLLNKMTEVKPQFLKYSSTFRDCTDLTRSIAKTIDTDEANLKSRITSSNPLG